MDPFAPAFARPRVIRCLEFLALKAPGPLSSRQDRSKQALGLPLPDLPPGRDRLISSGSDCPLPPDIIERELFRH
jgi:hypothetical protein